MVGLTGLEPVTSALSGRRSNRLSYRPAWAGTPSDNTTDSGAARSNRPGALLRRILSAFSRSVAVTALTGPSGRGKSTLLKLVAGVLLPDEGEVMVNGGVAPLIELTGGFEGVPDEHAQRGHKNGWRHAGLPWRQN